MNKILEASLLTKFKERHEHFTIKTQEDTNKLETIVERYPDKPKTNRAMPKSEITKLLHEEKTGYAHEKGISEEEKEFRHKFLKD